MACMEHVCDDCGSVWIDNQTNGSCPKCKSTNVGHYYDEPVRTKKRRKK